MRPARASGSVALRRDRVPWNTRAMLPDAACDEYLHRIGTDAALVPSAPALFRLVGCHARTVPFENLDIARGRALSLDETALFDKIVRRRRGGFCYEVNGLFASLLRALGFRVTLLAGRVAGADGSF